jgi:hypothetical protein
LLKKAAEGGLGIEDEFSEQSDEEEEEVLPKKDELLDSLKMISNRCSSKPCKYFQLITE